MCLRNNRGAALVEFAIVVSLLMVLLFGIIDFGWLIKDYLAINQAAREGARTAAIGKPTPEIVTRVLDSAPILGLKSADIVIDRKASGDTTWSALGNLGGQNSAASGDYIRVRVNLQHRWITGLFASSTPINAEMTIRRE
jgi:Flp pilus assembly protein TadG